MCILLFHPSLFAQNRIIDSLSKLVNSYKNDSLKSLEVTELASNYIGIMVLGLSTFNQGTYVNKMMENGASGYVLKNADKEELLEAIREVNKGKTYLSFEAGQAMRKDNTFNEQIPLLTRREKEVLTLIAEGYTNPEIAEKIFLSPSTVDSHRKNLLAKLNVKNTASLIRLAVEKKLI